MELYDMIVQYMKFGLHVLKWTVKTSAMILIFIIYALVAIVFALFGKDISPGGSSSGRGSFWGE